MNCSFIKVIDTKGNEKLVNVYNISSIILGNNKDIINFNNEINIIGKETSDFLDIKKGQIEKFEKELKDLFWKVSGQNEIVFKRNINSIKIDDVNKKIIFNLGHCIEIKDKNTGETKKVSKFVYWKFDDVNEYEKAKQKIGF